MSTGCLAARIRRKMTMTMTKATIDTSEGLEPAVAEGRFSFVERNGHLFKLILVPI
jgi:hypothetical protein